MNADEFYIFSIIDKLFGHECWHTKINNNIMTDNAPKFEKMIFDEDYLDSQIEDDEEDANDSINITETEDSIIVSTSDGRPNPTNEIFIFSKKDIDMPVESWYKMNRKEENHEIL